MLPTRITPWYQPMQSPWCRMIFAMAACLVMISQTTMFSVVFSKKQPLFETRRLQGNHANKCPAPDLSVAFSCLHQTTPSLTLSYPLDVKEHLLEIEEALRPWTQGSRPHCAASFCGPWIENSWIAQFGNFSETECFSDTFGPFVPLFIPWVDLWVGNRRFGRFKYPDGFVEAVKKVIRPDVPYITVSQNDQGLIGNSEMPLMHNILVLSAGGYGHVPIPLLKQDESPLENKPQKRKWLASYVGSLHHAPHKMRQLMHEYFVGSDSSYTYFYGGSWRDVMADSWTSLAPRGFGRTSYHVMETLQQGLIPIHVYSDVPWVPYLDLFQTLGFIATLEELPALYHQLDQVMTTEHFLAREAKILSYRDSHFTRVGVMQQIGLFMKGTGDLRCTPLPESIRGAGHNGQ